MTNRATIFIQNRPQKLQVTSQRIGCIIWYVIQCYKILRKDKPTYSISKHKAISTVPFEDHLRFRLVNDYLIKNKNLLAEKYSVLETINFHPERQSEYFDISKNKNSADKIDIYINRLGLQEVWNEQDENIYFVFECKRIKILSDCKAYIEDTQKFTQRHYNNLRLPFEGQLAFIESNKLNHASVSDEINQKLKGTPTITTTQYLLPTKGYLSFTGSYYSEHKRNHTKKEKFGVSHLLLDYSKIVVS